MTQYEMTEKLSEKMNVTMEEAKAALEASDWNMLDAALALEQTHGFEKPGKGRRHGVGHVLRELCERGNRNRFVARRGDAVVLDMPVTALALLMLCAFWVCVPLLVIGLFAGCRYGFRGADLGREGSNAALDRAADAAERVKETVAEA